MKSTKFAAGLVMVSLLASLSGCGGDDGPTGPRGPFRLTFAGDAGFQGPHGGQRIQIAVRRTGGPVLLRASGVVSATFDPAFSFSFPDLLEEGSTYEIDYWIDSNFGGGTEGVCDPRANDHQWRVSLTATSEDLTVTESHNAGATVDVCSSFQVDLQFSGDAGFQGPHGGQVVSVLVLTNGEVVASGSATVSASANPSFSFNFAGLLSIGATYQVEYWIDSNFGGGTEGVCDPRATDHQWRVDIPAVTDDVSLTESHSAGTTTDVCSSFAFDLEFSGDASFQGPHGGHSIALAVVRAPDGLVVASVMDVVSEGEDLAFAFAFDGLLVRGVDYYVDYWIDSNFGGGTEGVCDPRANDHQWRVDISEVTADVAIADTHRAAETEDVCPTFSGDGNDGGGGPAAMVTIGDNFFNPTNVVVAPGSTVQWTWTGFALHNVTFASGQIADSDTRTSGEYEVIMPLAPGAYDYQCTIHPAQMNGTVTVQ